MSSDYVLTKDSLETCLKELGKVFRKLNGKHTPAELILVGGAAVLINYGFRDQTADIDAIILASSAMKDAVNVIKDKFDLPDDWLNEDFTKTTSYSPKLIEVSRYFKTYSGILQIRTISGAYLIAMKLMSGRQYKNDISDIVGILSEEKKAGNFISFEQIDQAVCKLYGGWERMPSDSRDLITGILSDDDPDALYDEFRQEEKKIRDSLITFDKEYPGALRTSSLNEIIELLKKK